MKTAIPFDVPSFGVIVQETDSSVAVTLYVEPPERASPLKYSVQIIHSYEKVIGSPSKSLAPEAVQTSVSPTYALIGVKETELIVGALFWIVMEALKEGIPFCIPSFGVTLQ